MRATYHQPFAQPGPLYPYSIKEIGLGLTDAGKFEPVNVLTSKTLGVFETYAEAEAATKAEVDRVSAIENSVHEDEHPTAPPAADETDPAFGNAAA